MEVYNFINRKGGVGKTTTTWIMGEMLGYIGKSVLFIDLDPQMHLNEYCKKIENESDIYSLFKKVQEQGLESIEPEDHIFQTRTKNVYILPGSGFLEHFEKENDNKNILKDVLSLPFFEENFDFVLIDNQPQLKELAELSINASDKIVCPVFAEEMGISGLLQMNHWLKDNFDKDFHKIIVNKYSRAPESKDSVIQLLSNFGRELISTFFVPLSSTPYKWKHSEHPFFYKRPKDKVSIAYMQQVIEVFGLVDGTKQEITAVALQVLEKIAAVRDNINRENFLKFRKKKKGEE